MEAECLRRYLDELARCIDNHEVVTLVITQLYTKGVFTPETQDELLNAAKTDPISHKTLTKIVTEIEKCVSSDPHQLGVVLEVLRNHVSCRNVANKIYYMFTNGGKAPPLTPHNALRLLQDSHFNVTKHWHQMGGDLGVLLDDRRRLQELAIRTQNYDGALEECLDWWISNTPDASWEILVETIERYEVSTSDRMRDLLNFPKIQRTNRSSGRLPRQGSSFESVTDHVETNNPSAPITLIPIRHTPSPSTATTGTNEPIYQPVYQPNDQPCHAPFSSSSNTFNDLSSSVGNMLTTDKQSSTCPDPIPSPSSTVCGRSSQAVVSQPHQNIGESVVNNCSTSCTDNNTKPSFHMECQLLNGETKRVIKSSQTDQADIKAPVYRDIRIKRISKYNSIPPLTPLIVKVTVNTSCYLYVINIGSSGNLATLIPNDMDDNNKAEEGKVVQFPPPEAEYEFELDSNSGTEIVIVLAYGEKVSADHAEEDCRKMREKVVVERDITIKRKKIVPVHVPIGTVEMQFSVKSN